MKKTLFIVLVSILLLPGISFASWISIEVSGDYATEPAEDFDSTVGPGVGVNVDFDTLINVSEKSNFKKYSKNIKFRTDLRYFKWEDEVFGVDVEYKRIPWFIGLRYYFPIKALNEKRIGLFGEGGAEISFDEEEAFFPPFGKTDDDDVNFGPAVGTGIQYSFTDLFYAGAQLRYHAVKDDYVTVGAYIGFNIN